MIENKRTPKSGDFKENLELEKTDPPMLGMQFTKLDVSVWIHLESLKH